MSRVVNFRDVGVESGVGKCSGMIFRAGLVKGGKADQRLPLEEFPRPSTVIQKFGIRTLIDLRGRTERDENDYAELIPHFFGLVTPEVGRELDARKGTVIPRAELYAMILSSAGFAIASAVRIISDPSNYPVMYFCALGRVRYVLCGCFYQVYRTELASSACLSWQQQDARKTKL